ncbi:MAG: DedA family protein [Alphaproteobacteria bacterium]|nr:DedA family protein [Alphaproteobacteria bacterium]
MAEGYLYVALFSFAAATIVPFPSEPVVMAIASQQGYQPWLVWLVATAANTAGSAVNWWLGRACLKWQGRRWFPVTPAQLSRASRWFQSWGQWALLMAWLPILGDALTVAAGVLRVRLSTFVILVAIGKAARYAAVLGALDGMSRVLR